MNEFRTLANLWTAKKKSGTFFWCNFSHFEPRYPNLPVVRCDNLVIFIENIKKPRRSLRQIEITTSFANASSTEILLYSPIYLLCDRCTLFFSVHSICPVAFLCRQTRFPTFLRRHHCNVTNCNRRATLCFRNKIFSQKFVCISIRKINSIFRDRFFFVRIFKCSNEFQSKLN